MATTTHRPNCREQRLVGLFADEERNALMTALRDAALTDTAGCPYSEGDRIYLYVENTPKTSLVSEMVDHLHRIGYCIKPNAKAEPRGREET